MDIPYAILEDSLMKERLEGGHTNAALAPTRRPPGPLEASRQHHTAPVVVKTGSVVAVNYSTAANTGALVISLDFELHWGLRDSVSADQAEHRFRGTREAIPHILDLFTEYGVHATWAVCGFLFARTRDELLGLVPRLTPQYTDYRLDPYADIDTLGAGEREDPAHFAPSLIARIRDTPGQEIASHTFSHYYCLADGQTQETFEADVQAAQAAARLLSVQTTSIVFPRNQRNPAYLDSCRKLGFTAYRGPAPNWLYRRGDGRSIGRRAARLLDSYLPLTGPNSIPFGALREATPSGHIYNVAASHFLRPYSSTLARLEPTRESRVLRALNAAATGSHIYHLWWHPHNFGLHLSENLHALDTLLRHFTVLRERHAIESLSMSEAADRASKFAAV